MPYCTTAVQHVAHRLIASSFFLDVSKRVAHDDGTCSFACSILCKFEDGTQNVRSLGRFLRKTSRDDFLPYLLVKGDTQGTASIVHEIPLSLIKRMIDEAVFLMPALIVAVEDDSRPSNITLVLSPHDGLEPDGFSLSGMPKILAKECHQRPTVRKPGTSSTSNMRASPVAATPARNGLTSCDVSRSDTISLNERPGRKLLWAPTAGPLAGLQQLDRADMAPEVHIKPFSAEPRVSYREVKGPNRFWAYIAPAHMAKHRHLYSQEVLARFVPSVAAEPVELDAGDETEIKRMTYAELENDSNQPKRASVHHEVHAESSPIVPQRERSDSARDLNDRVSVTETVIGDYTARFPPLSFLPPPAYPPRKHGFDPGELEAAIEAAFG